MYGAYIIHNPETDETYVGSGVLKRRAQVHERTLLAGTHHNHRLQEAFNRNPNFDFVGVPMENQDEARAFEQFMLNEHWGNPLLLNLNSSAYACNSVQTPEVREKISKKIKALHAAGELASPMKGKTHSEDTKRKYSEQRLGNQNALGHTHSDEWKQAQSERMSGNQHLSGHRHSDETKKKMSEAHLGKKKSEEAIMKAARNRTKEHVVVDNVGYWNVAAAAEVLGLSPSGVKKRALSDKFPNYELIPVKGK